MLTICAVAEVIIKIVWYVNFVDFQVVEALKHYDKIGFTSMIETGLILDTYCVRYPLANPFLNFFRYFITPNTSNLQAVYEGFIFKLP